MSRSAPNGDPVQTLHYAMRQVTTLGASDLHLKAGSPPYVRLNGELTAIPGMYSISDEEMDKVVRELSRHAPNRLREFEQAGETDLAYELQACARFRVSIFRQRGKISAALRVIPEEVPELSKLNLPPVIETLSMVPRGLILVTGATGSGKTTTLSAMLNHINEHEAKHIVTVEDPIEIVHRDKKALVNQREVGIDTGSFGGALRRALRQDPDVILIGEMRDEETVRTALSAAETGHLVFSTLHTIDVMESIYRILDFFPPELERQARNMLAGTLKGIISQRLVQTKDGRSRVPAVEVLVGTSRIADCILRPEDTEAIHDAVAEGGYYGMQSFDQSLLQLVLDDMVTVEEAMYYSNSKQNFALLLEAHSVNIDRDLRRRASGSMKSIQDDVTFDEARHRSGAHDAPAAQVAQAVGAAPPVPVSPAMQGAVAAATPVPGMPHGAAQVAQMATQEVHGAPVFGQHPGMVPGVQQPHPHGAPAGQQPHPGHPGMPHPGQPQQPGQPGRGAA